VTGWLVAAALVAAVTVWRGSPAASRLRSWHPAGRDRRSETTRVAVIGAGLLAGGVAAVVVGISPVAVGLVVGGVGAVAGTLRARRRSQQRTEESTAVVEVTFALASELRAGRTPTESLAAVIPVAGAIAEPLRLAHRAAAAGESAADVLAGAASNAGLDRLRPVAAAWRVAETAGGRVAPVLERLGEAMDADLQLRRELDASLAGPRATMLLLAVLPAFGILLGEAMGADPLKLLLRRPIGWGLMLVAGGLDVVGVWVLRRITAGATR
jgi:tight adherence protein B